jgi:lysyl-tRNA synthetase class 2
MGINPFPAEAFSPSHSTAEAVTAHRDPAAELRLSGRVGAYRALGKAIFIDLLDEEGKLQLFLSRNTLGRDWELAKLLDLGDYVGVMGSIFITRRGETTLEVRRLTLLGKALRPPPVGKTDAAGVVHEAIADTGRLLRDRHLAFLTDPRLRRRIKTRDLILREIRRYFWDEGFTEIETPVIGRAYGGAAAQPFETYSEALDAKMYLRVSPELNLKRALCGGFTKVFEIGKNFRNEGIDHSHSPEFEAIEWYEASSDYYEQMVRFETLVARVAESINDTTTITFRGKLIDLAPPWPRLRILDLVAAELGIRPADVTEARLSRWWEESRHPGPRPANWGQYLIAIFEAAIEPKLEGAVFIMDHPLEGSPLTKQHRDDPRLVERFEPFIGSLELGNAYSELNDAEEQRRRLENQDRAREEPYGVDEDFLLAMEHGMPQAGGAGLGLDRLIMIITEANRLSDVIAFPAV